MGCAILAEEMLNYYRNRQLLAATNECLDRLKSLNTDYDILLERFEDDPNIYERIGPATLGTRPADANAVYPKVRAEHLDAARKALIENNQQHYHDLAIPRWLERCNELYHRIVLFCSGAVLIIISFACFGTIRRKSQANNQLTQIAED